MAPEIDDIPSEDENEEIVIVGSLRTDDGDAEDNVYIKRKLYFTCESRGTLKSFTLFVSVKAITKLIPGHIDISQIKT